jgi:sugar phosphate permease
MLICGLIGSVLSGLILDKTKRFEELSKICFGTATIAAILFTILSLYNNDRATVYYLTLLSFALIGFFGIIRYLIFFNFDLSRLRVFSFVFV